MTHDRVNRNITYYYVRIFKWTTQKIRGEEISEYEPFMIFESNDYEKALSEYEKVEITIDTPQADLFMVNESVNESLKTKDQFGEWMG